MYGGFFMPEEKKQGHLKPETREKLKLCLEMSAEDTVDLMTEAYGQDLFDKKGRGDKVWLYKGAKEALSCMEKIKRVLNDDQTVGSTDGRSITPEQQAAQILESVAQNLDGRKPRPERPS